MLYIFNTTIITTPGLTYHTSTITAEQARRILGNADAVTSAIGHDSTAQIASTVLGCPIAVNRIAASMSAGDAAICVKLRGRPHEGVILTANEVEAIGYDLVLMSAVDQSRVSEDCHRRTEPDIDYHPTPALEVSAAALVWSFDQWVSSAQKHQRAAGGSYSPDVPFDDTRAGMMRLCREVIDEHIIMARDGVTSCDELDAKQVRSSLVSRLVDMLQERGETVAAGPVEAREPSSFSATVILS